MKKAFWVDKKIMITTGAHRIVPCCTNCRAELDFVRTKGHDPYDLKYCPQCAAQIDKSWEEEWKESVLNKRITPDNDAYIFTERKNRKPVTA